MDLYPGHGLETSQPTPIGETGLGAVSGNVEHYVSLQVRNGQAAAALDGIDAADPHDRFLAPSRVSALLDAALAPQDPDFVGPPGPTIGCLGGEDDGLARVGGRKVDLRGASGEGREGRGKGRRLRGNLRWVV